MCCAGSCKKYLSAKGTQVRKTGDLENADGLVLSQDLGRARQETGCFVWHLRVKSPDSLRASMT